MKHSATVLALSAAVLLSGCGGVPRPAPIVSTSPTTSPTTQPPVTPSIANFTGNWQFSGASTVPGKPPLTFAGSISQADSKVSSALHFDGSNCFNRLNTVGLTGTVTADGISMTSTVVDGQVVTLTGNFTTQGDTASPGRTASTVDVMPATREPSPESTFSSVTLIVGTAHSPAPLKLNSTCQATSLKVPAPALTVALESPELPPSIHPVSVRRPSARDRFLPAASSWALLCLFKSRLTTAPSLSLGRWTRSPST
jgi:hypothetical protein